MIKLDPKSKVDVVLPKDANDKTTGEISQELRDTGLFERVLTVKDRPRELIVFSDNEDTMALVKQVHDCFQSKGRAFSAIKVGG